MHRRSVDDDDDKPAAGFVTAADVAEDCLLVRIACWYVGLPVRPFASVMQIAVGNHGLQWSMIRRRTRAIAAGAGAAGGASAGSEHLRHY